MGLTASEEKELRSKVDALREVQVTKRDSDKRLHLWVYGSLIVFNSAIAVFCMVTGAWSTMFINLINIAFISVIWVQQTLIADQHFVIKMQFGLRELETEELDKVFAKAEAGTKKAPVKKAKATK